MPALASNQSCDLLQLLLDTLPEHIYFKDQAGRFMHVSRSETRFHGLVTHQEMIGKTDFDLYPRDDAEGYRRDELAIMTSGLPMVAKEEWCVSGAGRRECFVTTKIPIRDGEGRVVGIAGISRDITDRKRAEQQLQQQRQEQEIILDSVPAMIWYKDRENRILRANRAAAASVGLTKAQIEGQSTYDLYPAHAAAYHRDDLEVIQSGRPKMGIVEQIQLSNGERRWIRTDKIPYRDEHGQIIGVIVFATDINDLKQAETALRESESTFRALAEHSSVGFWRITPEGYTLYINRSLCRMLEIDGAEDLEGRTYHEFFTAESLDRMKIEHAKRSLGQPSTYEVEIKGRRGGRRIVLISGSPLMNPDGTLGALVGTFTDITHLKQTEEALRREKQLMQIIMDNMPDAIYLKDRDSRFLRTNQEHARIMGLSGPEEAIGKTDEAFFAPEDAAKFMADERHVVQTGEPVVNRLEHHGGASGEMRWWSTTKVPVRDANGSIVGIAGITRDITKLRHVEEALRQQQQLMELLLDHVPDAIYFKDPQSRFLRVNPAQARYLGLTRPEEAIGRTDLEFFSAQAAASYLADEQQVIATGQPVIGRVEHNGRCGDELRWFSTTKVPIRDADGQVVGTAGISHEITKIKQSEEQIRTLNEELERRVADRTAKLEAANRRLEAEVAERRQAQRALQASEERTRLLIESALDAVITIDAAGVIAGWTAHAETTFGWSAAEAIGRRLSETIVPQQFRAAHLSGLRAFETTGTGPILGKRIEIAAVHRDGHEFPVEVSVMPLRRPDGIMFSAFVRDITQRKQAEEQVRVYQERLRSLASELSLAEERERRRIAIDLHDQIGQPLALLQIKLQGLRASADRDLARTIDECVELLRQPIQDTRSLTFNLSPPVLYDLGIEAAAAWLVDQHHERSGLRISLEDDQQPKPLHQAVAVLAFRAMRELLTNIIKHARATTARLWLRRSGAELSIGVEDNGVGFDAVSLGAHSERAGGFGLFSIREQVDRVGGRFQIDSAPGDGCRMILTVPLMTAG